MNFTLLGWNFRSTPLEIRDRLSLTEQEQLELVQQINARCGIQESVLLSTCNRTELYLYNMERPAEELLELLQKRWGIPELLETHYLLKDEEAVFHLFRVASSLDSMVVGEPQILGQLKDAFGRFQDPAVLDALPSGLQTQSAAVAAARVRLANGENASTVMQRWPNDPDVWQLQWDLARAALLKQQWSEAKQLLERDTKLGPLPGPLEARRLFWLGFSLEQQGEQAAAHQLWERFIHSTPPGYYRWRAMERLKQTPPLDLRQPLSTPTPDAWRPLNSDSALTNTLWRLGLTAQAWDAWRSAQAPNQTTSHPEQLVEGRLRLALGDTWKGLDQIWRLSLRWRSPNCTELEQLHRSQLPRLFTTEMSKAADAQQLRQELLLAISKQESRFSPGVTSPVGAIGLMQLMPATANELAGTTLTEQMLREPRRNINLGARYLDQLLALWEGDPFRSIASYNAGPGAVSSWPDPNGEIDPALWVERIPYPETRYYTKKVLDNLIRYSERNHSFCEPTSGGIGKQVTQANTTEHQNGQRQH